MKIGGLIKSSMIDYPGKISCVVFTCGCNFICPYCHNSELIKTVGEEVDTGFDAAEILSFLDKRKQFLEGVVITGGEPTLQKDLARFCEEIKKAGFPIKLDSNGSHPEMLITLIRQGLVDYIAMDIKAEPSAYSPLLAKQNYSDKIIESIETIMASDITYEFRTTCAKPFVNRDMIQKVGKLIQGAERFALQRFNPSSVLNRAFFDHQGDGYGDEELESFKAIAENYVKVCTIR